MKRKTICSLMFAALIAMAVFVGSAAADSPATIFGSKEMWMSYNQSNYTITDNLYGYGVFGDYSHTPDNPPCPDGCGGRIYVVNHQETWTNGTPLYDVSKDGKNETVSWNNFGFGSYFEMVWPTPLTPGTYDLILDLDVSGYPYVWTNITNPYAGSANIIDPIRTIRIIRIIDVAGSSPLVPAAVYKVYIDIKPESCPNPINVGMQGLQSVAVLGTEEFDVSTIDNSTIWLTRVGYEDFEVAPLRWSYEDVATPFEGELCDCHELGGDGYIDLTLKFKTQELVDTLELKNVVGMTLPLNLTGNLYDGTSFEGQDCIWVL